MLDCGRKPIETANAAVSDPGQPRVARPASVHLLPAFARRPTASLARFVAAAGLLPINAITRRNGATAPIYIDPQDLPGAGKETAPPRQQTTETHLTATTTALRSRSFSREPCPPVTLSPRRERLVRADLLGGPSAAERRVG